MTIPQSPQCGDSCLRAARSAALTVHRTVIHYRRLRFAYPPRGRLWGAAMMGEWGGFGGRSMAAPTGMYDRNRRGEHCSSAGNAGAVALRVLTVVLVGADALIVPTAGASPRPTGSDGGALGRAANGRSLHEKKRGTEDRCHACDRIIRFQNG